MGDEEKKNRLDALAELARAKTLKSTSEGGQGTWALVAVEAEIARQLIEIKQFLPNLVPKTTGQKGESRK